MTESSGCDPQLATRTRSQAVDDGIKRLLVDGEKAGDWFEQRDPGDEDPPEIHSPDESHGEVE